MKRINKTKQAFSLAEMMIVMLVLTIVLAASMPIISKRTKIKPTSSGSTSNILTCTKQVYDTWTVTVPTTVKFMTYTLVGGGGGGSCAISSGYSSYAYGGGGGSTGISIDGGSTLYDYASGGAGAIIGSYATSLPGASGSIKQGFIPVGSSSTLSLLVIVGGGGGGGGRSTSTSSATKLAYGGAGGAGYFGGGGGRGDVSAASAASTGGSNVVGVGSVSFPAAEVTCGMSAFKDATANRGGRTASSYILGGSWACGDQTRAAGGSTIVGTGGAVAEGWGGGGGAFGAKGGNGSVAPTKGSPGGNQQTTTVGTGAGGAGCLAGTGATGGEGGSAVIIYMTTASSCNL